MSLNIQKKHSIRQLIEINLLREEMSKFVNFEKNAEVLFIGEGVQWNSTFLGCCIINDLIPKTELNITVLDLNFNGKLTFADDLSFEGYEHLNIKPLLGDATSMSFKTETFDYIIAPLMIDDCFDHHALLREMKRCVKRKTGKVILSGHGTDSNTFLKHIRNLYGSDHINQTNIKEIQDLLNSMSSKNLHSWETDHCWLLVFKWD